MSDSEQEEIIKPPPKEEPGKKFFLAHSNTYEGMALFKELYNRDTCREPELAAHSFVGTVKKSEKTPAGNFQMAPTGLDRLVEFGRTKDFRETLLESEVIVYDLMSNDYEEVDYVIKTLKTSTLTEPKTLVLLSSVMTWVNTPPKFTEEKPEGADGEEEAEAEPEEEEEEGEEPEPEADEENKEDGPVDENGEPIERQKPLFFKESDFHLRVPHAKYEHLKTLETLAMSSTTTQPLLRVHVLCTGVRYGNGERTFYDHFFKAWI
jgi:adenylate kinase